MMDPPAIAWSSLAKGSPRFYWNIFHHFLAQVAAQVATGQLLAVSGALIWIFGIFGNCRFINHVTSCGRPRIVRPDELAPSEGTKKVKSKLLSVIFSPLLISLLCAVCWGRRSLSLCFSLTQWMTNKNIKSFITLVWLALIEPTHPMILRSQKKRYQKNQSDHFPCIVLLPLSSPTTFSCCSPVLV